MLGLNAKNTKSVGVVVGPVLNDLIRLSFPAVASKVKRAKSNCSKLSPAIYIPAHPTPRLSSSVAVTPQFRKQLVIDLTFDSDEEETQIPVKFTLLSSLNKNVKMAPQHRIHETFLQTTSTAHKVCYCLMLAISVKLFSCGRQVECRVPPSVRSPLIITSRVAP